MSARSKSSRTVVSAAEMPTAANPFSPITVARRLAATVKALSGWRRAAVAFVTGALSILAFAPFFVSPVLFVTLPVLFWLSEAERPGSDAARPSWPRRILSASLVGWWFGFGFHLAGLYWIGSAFLVEADRFAIFMPLAVTAMPAGLALFTAAALGAARLARGPVASRVIVFAVALAVSEWLRGTIFTGFPWNTLGYAATYPLVLLQSAGVVGIYGLSLLVALVATLPLVLLSTPGVRLLGRDGIVLGALACFPVLLALIYGTVVLNLPLPPDVAGVKLRLVQPNIRQSDKFLPEKRLEIFERHLNLTTSGGGASKPSTAQSGGASVEPGANTLAGITHVIWPEAAMPFLALRSPEALSRIADALPDTVTLIAGTLRLEGSLSPGPGERQDVFNSAIVLDGRGELLTRYDKIHLVPFGEYLPFKTYLNAIGFEHLTRQRGGFSPGHAPRKLMHIPGLPPLSMMICYEVIFPGAARDIDGRPSLLLNLTNDAWFGTTTGPYQHFQQARVRAVEQGVPMIRVANNGITGVVDARGRIRQSLPLNTQGIIDTPLPHKAFAPIYSRYCDIIFFALLGLAMAVAASLHVWRRRDTTAVLE